MQFADEDGLDFSKKSARMLILGLAATDGAFEAVWKIRASSRSRIQVKIGERGFS